MVEEHFLFDVMRQVIFEEQPGVSRISGNYAVALAFIKAVDCRVLFTNQV